MPTATKTYSYRIGVDSGDSKKTWNEFGDAAERNFQRATRAADQASSDLERATARQKAALDKLEAIRVITPQQRQVMDTVSTAGDGKSAKASAAAFREMLVEQEAVEKRALALKLAIDPVAGAQLKMNAAVAEANALLGKGAITQAEHTAALKLAKKAFDDAAAGANATGHAVSGMGGKVREALVILRELGRGDFTRLAGSATIEAQRLGVLEMVMNPVGLSVIALTAAIAGCVLIEEHWISSQERITLTLRGMGAASGDTLTKINALAAAEERRGQISAASARTIAAAMAGTGRVGPSNIGAATDVVKDYAATTNQDVKAATAELSKAFADPAKGAEELNAKLNFLSAAQLEHIKLLQDEGKRSEALAFLLKELGPAVDGAAKHLTGFAALGDTISKKWDGASEAIARYIGIVLRIPAADPVERWANLQRDKSNFQANPANKVLYDPSVYAGKLKSYDDQMAQAQREIDDSDARRLKAQQNLRSNDLKAAYSALNPQSDQIDALRAKIGALKTATPDDLKNMGKTKSQADAAIADGEREIVQLQKRSEHLDKHAESLARDAAAMEANARGAQALAAAYLQSDQAAIVAEARRKASTDATKKGIDVEAETRRQLAVTIGEDQANSAKSIRQLLDETSARAGVNLQVENGKLAIGQVQRALSDEAALRPLTILQLVTEGAQRQRITAMIELYRKALADAHAEEGRSNFAKVLDDGNAAIDRLKLQAKYAGDTTGRGQIALAQQASNRQADQEDDDPARRVQRVGLDTSLAAQTVLTDRATTLAQIKRTQDDELATMRVQLSMAGQSQTSLEVALGLERVKQQLQAKGVDLSSDEAKSIMDQARQLALVNAGLLRVNAMWGELRQTGDQVIDSLNRALTPEGWGKWSEAGRSAISALATEGEKLAFLNPLKNLLFGESNPTLFGGGSAGAGIVSQMLKFIPGFANGTDSAPGGLSWVGENGKELMNVPRGAQIHSAADSAAMMKTATRPAAVQVVQPIYFDNRGAMTTAEFMDQANANATRAANGAGRAAFKAAHDANPTWAAQTQAELG